jgi:hypothetical protein
MTLLGLMRPLLLLGEESLSKFEIQESGKLNVLEFAAKDGFRP